MDIGSDQIQPTSPSDGELITNSVENVPYSELRETLQIPILPVMAIVTVASPFEGRRLSVS